jgi:serine/threonine-protein kinase RsbW
MFLNAIPSAEPRQKSPIWQYRTSVSASVGSITPVVDQVMELGQETACFSGKEMEIETALREALANAIVHGCENDGRQTIQLAVSCDEDLEIEMVVRNPGSGFDPKSVPNPTLSNNIYNSHGRGVYLISRLMDEVRYERGGSEIHMRKR